MFAAIFVCLSLSAQTPQEVALSKTMAQEILKSGPAIGNERLQSYVRKLGARLAPDHTFTLIAAGVAPVALPDKTVLIPLSTLLDAGDEAAFSQALARAVSIPGDSHWTGGQLPLALQEKTNRAAALLMARAGFEAGVNSEEFSRIQEEFKTKPRTPPTLYAK